MWHVGIDLHRTTVVLAAVNDGGEIIDPITIPCSDPARIVRTASAMGTFRAVIEATGTYRWLYDLLRPHGAVLLAHPLRLRAMIQRRTKTDKLDAQLLANLLRIDQIPLAYIPPEPYQQLRDLTRGRARLGRHLAEAKVRLRDLLARQNRESPYRTPFGARGLAWFRGEDFGPIEDMVRDELLERFQHYAKQMGLFDKRLETMRQAFPQVECLCGIRGIGLYSALLIVAELGEVESGGHCYQGSITRQGSPWLRWVFVQAAMKAVQGDEDLALKNFYQRIRKRSGAKIARVAAARKLAEICWKRLRRWHREHAGQAA
jgi:transposase